MTLRWPCAAAPGGRLHFQFWFESDTSEGPLIKSRYFIYITVPSTSLKKSGPRACADRKRQGRGQDRARRLLISSAPHTSTQAHNFNSFTPPLTSSQGNSSWLKATLPKSKPRLPSRATAR